MRAWISLTLIALGVSVAQAFGRFAYGVLLPAIRDDMGISNTIAGSISAVNVGAYLLGTLGVAWAAGHMRMLSVLRVGRWCSHLRWCSRAWAAHQSGFLRPLLPRMLYPQSIVLWR